MLFINLCLRLLQALPPLTEAGEGDILDASCPTLDDWAAGTVLALLLSLWVPIAWATAHLVGVPS